MSDEFKHRWTSCVKARRCSDCVHNNTDECSKVFASEAIFCKACGIPMLCADCELKKEFKSHRRRAGYVRRVRAGVGKLQGERSIRRGKTCLGTAEESEGRGMKRRRTTTAFAKNLRRYGILLGFRQDRIAELSGVKELMFSNFESIHAQK